MKANSGFTITADEIQRKVAELGQKITKDYEGKQPVFVGILKGAFMFMADLIRHVDLPLEIDFLAVSSYGKSTESSGAVMILKDIGVDIEGRDVLIVEDILDTGLTLKHIVKHLMSKHPKSLKICVLLDKKERRKVQIDADYVGFEVPDKFLVGYGLDYAERYRNLPYIRELSPEEVVA